MIKKKQHWIWSRICHWLQKRWQCRGNDKHKCQVEWDIEINQKKQAVIESENGNLQINEFEEERGDGVERWSESDTFSVQHHMKDHSGSTYDSPKYSG